MQNLKGMRIWCLYCNTPVMCALQDHLIVLPRFCVNCSGKYEVGSQRFLSLYPWSHQTLRRLFGRFSWSLRKGRIRRRDGFVYDPSQHQWYHFGVGAPPILEPMLVGIGMFTGGTIWVLSHSHIQEQKCRTSFIFGGTFGQLQVVSEVCNSA